MDYKEWIQKRAEDMADGEYNSGFYGLPEEVQLAVYNRAIEDYKDHVADKIDATREGK